MSCLRAQRFTSLKKGDFVDINPKKTGHSGWTYGIIQNLDNKSRVAVIRYRHPDKNCVYLVHLHLDKKKEIAPFCSKIPLSQRFTKLIQLKNQDYNSQMGTTQISWDYDCKTNKDTNNDESLTRSQVPNFIGLFILNRILLQFAVKNDKMMSLFTECTLNSRYYESKTRKMIAILLKYGLKVYMSDHYSEIPDSQAIDLIFEKIIFKHFTKQYQQITHYKCNPIDWIKLNNFKKIRKDGKNGQNGRNGKNIRNHSNVRNNFGKKGHPSQPEFELQSQYEYLEKLFNTRDLMCSIFQFVVGYGAFITNISLVCSRWLYHSFDSKSYRYCQAHMDILDKISHFNPKVDAKRALEQYKSNLQRFYQSTSFHWNGNSIVTQEVLLRLACFTRLEELIIVLKYTNSEYIAQQMKMLKVLSQRSGDKIKSFSVGFSVISNDSDDDDSSNFTIKLPVVKLNKVEMMYFHFMCFAVIFSNKLKYLSLDHVFNMTSEWIRFVIDNCDCTNIVTLKVIEPKLDQKTLDLIDYNLTATDKCQQKNVEIDNLISNFAKKFVALKKLELVLKSQSDNNDNNNNNNHNNNDVSKLIYFWSVFVKALEKIVSKNDTFILSDSYLLSNINVSTPVIVPVRVSGKLKTTLDNELEDILKHPSDYYQVTTDKYNDLKWYVSIIVNTENGKEKKQINMTMEFDKNYPKNAPTVFLNKQVYSSNFEWNKSKRIREYIDFIVAIIISIDSDKIENSNSL